MFTVELYAAIRCAVMIEELNRQEAARRFGVLRNTITKMILYSAPPGYRRRERPISKKLGPYMVWSGSTRLSRTTGAFTHISDIRRGVFSSGCGTKRVLPAAAPTSPEPAKTLLYPASRVLNCRSQQEKLWRKNSQSKYFPAETWQAIRLRSYRG